MFLLSAFRLFALSRSFSFSLLRANTRLLLSVRGLLLQTTPHENSLSLFLPLARTIFHTFALIFFFAFLPPKITHLLTSSSFLPSFLLTDDRRWLHLSFFTNFPPHFHGREWKARAFSPTLFSRIKTFGDLTSSGLFFFWEFPLFYGF